ncbi:hypothetical protein MRY87_06880 [bacterium]|nr:hypothetical protein [bacterium]
MPPIRIKEFIEKTNFPHAVVIAVLSDNQIPLSIDNEGYLQIELTQDTVAKILNIFAEEAPQAEIAEFTRMTLEHQEELVQAAEAIIREELQEIFCDVLKRLEERASTPNE